MPRPPGGRERRRFQRIGFQAQAILDCDTGELPVSLLDLSLAGALFRATVDPALQVGSECRLCVALSDEAHIEMPGTIVRHDRDKYALQRNTTTSAEDYHLRRLLELNLNDPELLERDLRRLTEQNRRD